MVAGCAHPMGPLALTDLIGLDTTQAVAQSMYAEFKEPLYAPPPLLLRMVEAGLLGRKTGRGFFDYPARSEPLVDGPGATVTEAVVVTRRGFRTGRSAAALSCCRQRSENHLGGRADEVGVRGGQRAGPLRAGALRRPAPRRSSMFFRTVS